MALPDNGSIPVRVTKRLQMRTESSFPFSSVPFTARLWNDFLRIRLPPASTLPGSLTARDTPTRFRLCL
jgi:hypothetical protein